MKKPFLYASGAALYIIIIVFVVQTVSSALQSENGTLVIPMTMLSLFVLSAAVMGFLFLSEPLYLLVENRKRERLWKFVGEYRTVVGYVDELFYPLTLLQAKAYHLRRDRFKGESILKRA